MPISSRAFYSWSDWGKSLPEETIGETSLEQETEIIQTRRERERVEVGVLSLRHTPSSTILVVPSNSTDHLAAARDTKLIEKETPMSTEVWVRARRRIEMYVLTPEGQIQQPPTTVPLPNWESAKKAREEEIKKYVKNAPKNVVPLIFRGEDPTTHPPVIHKVVKPLTKKQKEKLAKEKKDKKNKAKGKKK